MINEESLEQFFNELNIPSGVVRRLQEVAFICGILTQELMVRMIMRLYDTSEQTMRNLIDPTYDWDDEEAE